MTTLTVFSESDPETPLLETVDPERIAAELSCIGVRFEQWEANAALSPEAGQEEIAEAYAHDIERLKAEGGYTAMDVIRMHPEHPDREALRAKFLSEHRHTEDEVRFFVEGSGAFYLHADGKVFRTVCERGDLMSVPDGLPHWFDAGPRPSFAAIRLFTNTEGWQAHYTGADIAERFPRYGE